MNDEMQEIFREMDAMMNRILIGMDDGFPVRLSPGLAGCRFVIHGGDSLPGQESGEEIPGREPGDVATEVHRIGGEVKVIAELPGITEDALRLSVKGGRLIIDAGDADRHYHSSADLPPVDEGSMCTTLRNGVLEVTFAAAGDSREPEGTSGT